MGSKKIRIAVMMGGKSSEHDISLISGKEVVKNLDSKSYDVLPVVISKDGKNWQVKEKEKFLKLRGKRNISKSAKRQHFADIEKTVDVVFIAIHGAGGEDGKIQALLDLSGIAYTGSGVLASALAMDKEKAKIILKDAGLKTPHGFVVECSQPGNYKEKVSFPIFVKPNSHGSSVGSSIAKNAKELVRSIKLAHKYDKLALVEEYLKGTEITCAILGNELPKALPLVEICSKNKFFDFESKYDPRLSEEICPARLPETLTKKAQDIAIRAFQAIGCRGFARVDMIIKDSIIYVLEVNTIPGLTPVSLFPKAALAAGLSYSQLLDKIIQYAQYDHQN